MKKINLIISVLFIFLYLTGCSEEKNNNSSKEVTEKSNPFLESDSQIIKADTGYINPRAVEVHVELESDIEAAAHSIFKAPAEQALYSSTYLRSQMTLHVEILPEDTTPQKVEWLVDGEWINYEQARQIEKSKLTHFRLKDVSGVIYKDPSIQLDDVYKSEVPVNPYTVFSLAGDSCAKHDDHLPANQSIYWYLWRPQARDCTIPKTEMTFKITEIFENNPESYPEFDKLWEDKKLDIVVLFGKVDDGPVSEDSNWNDVEQLVSWLKSAEFTEEENAPLGRRFVKTINELKETVDIFGPDLFESVADYANFSNWQKAVSEHEVIMYSGHSILGSGMAFERAEYPSFYQVFHIASCLSYEYYVNPILEGKGDWGLVDVVSNIQPTSYSQALTITATVMSKLIWGFENSGRASWQDIMESVSRKVGHSRFGVSGARNNCFSPEGNKCETENPTNSTNNLIYENNESIVIPDEDENGIISSITVPDEAKIRNMSLELNILHTFVGDLSVELIHNGISSKVWDRKGTSDDNLTGNFDVPEFYSMDVKGIWELKVIDFANDDIGTLNNWSLNIAPQ